MRRHSFEDSSHAVKLASFSGALSAISKPQPMWSVQDVQEFLRQCADKLGSKVHEYQRLVAENDIDGEVLRDLEDDDLLRLGIKSLGHRLFVLKAVRHCRGSDNQPCGPSAARADAFGSPASTAPASLLVAEERFTFTTAEDAADAQGQGQHRPQDVSGLDNPQGARAIAQIEPQMHKTAPRIHESKITCTERIGSGSVATVYAGLYEGRHVAVKKHTLDSGVDGKHRSDLQMEVGKMIAISHPCVVRCFGMLEPTPGIVLELVEGGSVFEIIHGCRGESFLQYNARLPWEVRPHPCPCPRRLLQSARLHFAARCGFITSQSQGTGGHLGGPCCCHNCARCCVLLYFAGEIII